MFEKKFLDFLMENNIDKDLIIRNNREEYVKFKKLLGRCMLINIKTLMPYEELKIKQSENGKMIITTRSIKLRSICCIKEHSVFMESFKCKDCNASKMDLCAFNGVYKTDGIIIKRK